VLSNEVVGRAPIKNRSLFKSDEWHSLYCFARKEDALAFQLTFGGKLQAPQRK
jgi:hypothetical protein